MEHYFRKSLKVYSFEIADFRLENRIVFIIEINNKILKEIT